MIFDAPKVTYNMYSCAISGMSREIMKMDGRDSAECQNWENMDIMVILEFDLNDNKTKKWLQCSSPIKGKVMQWGWTGFGAAAENGDFP